MILLIIGFIILVGMEILVDFLIFKQRGKAQPDDPKDKNPPVITGPGDASAQRYLDLFFKKKSKK